MDSVSINLQSSRAAKARFARHAIGGSTERLLQLGVVLGLCAGLLLVVVGQSGLGWFVLSLCGPLAAFLFWIKGELRELPLEPKSPTLDGILDSELLGRLPDNATPQQLATIAMALSGGRFFAIRFGFGTETLPSLVSGDPSVSPKVWQNAEQLRRQLETDRIDSSILTVALFQTVDGLDGLLAHFRLDPGDLISGAEWYLHIRNVASNYATRRYDDGGIGRDWSFGFTPLLARFGTNISEMVMYGGLLHRELEGHGQVHYQMMQLLTTGARRNVTLVGPFGSGKTTIVRALAKKLIHADPSVPASLRYHQVIALDPSVLISQARGRGELEQLIQQLCYEALRAKNIILFMDDAHLFFEESTGSVDMSNILLPILEGGALRIILNMDEQKWQRISLTNTALAQYLNRIIVTPTDKAETMLVLQDQLIYIEYRQKVTYMHQALEAAYDLSSRYMNDQAMPGKALKLLESAAHYAEGNFVTRRSLEQAIEQTQGVKVTTADTAEERQTLLNMEDLIHQRMINQTRAVTVVSDALRRARAGVRNTQRPIGTFLFLGPTGVGKTELAKSLAAVYFGGEDRLVRIDLNEYVRPEDVSRLIADAATDPSSLTAQIGRQPFSVVLLDEIEKAHDTVLSTLLQTLDEGIMRDASNREVSFRDAIVIATSNAGADRIRGHIERGEQLEQFEEEFTNELISSNVFRPEFLNRFDEIVLFRPLTPDELVQVIDIILIGLNKNLAAQKISVTVDDEAKRLLVRAGYDPRLGARPMRRVVQRVVENLIAKRMLSGEVAPGQQIHLTPTDIATVLEKQVS